MSTWKPRTLRPWLAFALLAGFAAPSQSQEAEGNPVELGAVRWERDLQRALASAAESEKPVFALFQEIPGCLTCRNFGAGPLSHPLLVEAIEDLFVPLATYNNRPGADAAVLQRFGEPAWNNPVMRFLDADGRDLIARRDRLWSSADVSTRMLAALEAAKREVPPWLELAAQELSAPRLESATFEVPCYWSGEAHFGGLEGVHSTRAGWRGTKEVVEVRFDAGLLSLRALEAHARKRDYTRARGVLERGVEGSENKHDLAGSPLRFLPLTPLQRTRVNAALGHGRDPRAWLSPRQRALFARIEAVRRFDPTRLEGFAPAPDLGGLAESVRELEKRLGT